MRLEFITSLVRHLMTFGGGWLSTAGYATQDDVSALTGGVVVLIGLIWSWLAKSDKNPIV